MGNNDTATAFAKDFIHYTSKSLFLTGKAGTGKTTFLKQLKDNINKEVIIAAPTGVAAINAGGVTLHSLFQLRFKPFIPAKRTSNNHHLNCIYKNELIESIHFNKEKVGLLKALELLIIDEISMVRADMMDAIDVILKQVRKQQDKPFGGVQLLLIGDLLQLPPIVKNEDWEILKQSYQSPFFFRSKVLSEHPLAIIELKHIYRQSNSDFIRVLNNVRNNEMTNEDYSLLEKCYRPSLTTTNADGYITLTTHNHRADAINFKMLNALPVTGHCFEALISGDFDSKMFPAEEKLSLKEGTQIMFIKNDKGDTRRFFNGKICTVNKIEAEEVWVSSPGESDFLLEKESWKNIQYRYDAIEGKIKEDVIGEFKQYPIRLAWAITIHKSQGLTFEKAIIDAGNSFTAGQVYVALSRVKTLEGLLLRSKINPESIVSNEEALAFISNGIKNEGTLEVLLEREMKKYVLQKLLDLFSWKIIVQLVTDHRGNSEKWNYHIKSDQFRWEEEISLSLIKQQETVFKFRQQLENLFLHPSGSLTQLGDRIKSAVTYFINEIDWKIIPFFDTNLKKVKESKYNKNYLASLDLINKEFKNLKKSLNNALTISNESVDGYDYKIILSKLKGLKTNSNEVEHDSQMIEKNKKISPSSSNSFKLFTSGKSVAEIAKIRGLASYTIESHLTDFIKTGELSVFDVMSTEKVNEILSELNNNGHDLNAVKGKLGADYSYFNIRAVANHYLLAQEKTTDLQNNHGGNQGKP